MKARLTIMTLIALLCVALSIQTVAAGPADGSQASVYDYIKKAAESRQDELLYLLEEDISPQVMDSLRAALDSMQLAEETSQGDPEASLGYYMDALRLFRETWALYLEENKEGASTSFSPDDDTPEDPEVPEDLDEKIKETQVKRLEKFNENLIKEYMKIVDKVNALTEYVSGEETEEISTAVNDAKQKFNEVAKKIRKGEIDDVLDELDEETIPFGVDFDKLLELEESITQKNLRRSNREEEKDRTKETKSQDNDDEGVPGEEEEPKSGNGNGEHQKEPNLANVQKHQDEEPEEDPEVEPEDEPADEPKKEQTNEPKEEKTNKNQESVTEDEPEDKQAEKKEDKLQREVERLEEKIDQLEEKLSKKKNKKN